MQIAYLAAINVTEMRHLLIVITRSVSMAIIAVKHFILKAVDCYAAVYKLCVKDLFSELCVQTSVL